jgi:hypothetical protein
MAERQPGAHFILSVAADQPGAPHSALDSRHSSRDRYGEQKAHWVEVVRQEEVRTQGLLKARQQEVDGPSSRSEASAKAVHSGSCWVEDGAAGGREDLENPEEHHGTSGGGSEGHVRRVINILATPLAGR